jgi:hypothetical protein
LITLHTLDDEVPVEELINAIENPTYSSSKEHFLKMAVVYKNNSTKSDYKQSLEPQII